jgi:hypothetical protein
LLSRQLNLLEATCRLLDEELPAVTDWYRELNPDVPGQVRTLREPNAATRLEGHGRHRK